MGQQLLNTASLLACSLLLLLCASTAHAIKDPNQGPVLAPVLSSKASIQEYFEDSAVSCLRVTSTPWCRADIGILQDIETGVGRNTLSCCQAEASDDLFHPVDTSIGRCDYTYNYALDQGGGPPSLHGSFTATCALNSGASQCVTPFCDDMVLQVQGEILHYEDLVTDDPHYTTSDDCAWGSYINHTTTARANSSASDTIEELISRRRSHFAKESLLASRGKAVPRRGGKQKQQQRTVVGPSTTLPALAQAGAAAPAVLAATENYYGRGSPQLYPVYFADILSGPMTVWSKHRGQMWSGWFESVLFLDFGEAPISAAEAAGKYFIRPNDIRLKIFGQDNNDKQQQQQPGRY